MNEVLRFSYHQKPVRVYNEDGALWFCLSDVCSALGISDPSAFMKSEWCDHGRVRRIEAGRSGNDSVYIHERNALTFALRSGGNDAKRFVDWIEGDAKRRCLGATEINNSSQTPVIPISHSRESMPEEVQSIFAFVDNAEKNIVFEGNPIRFELIDGKPWFIAKDVCQVLGLDNSRRALSTIRAANKVVTTSNTLGGRQKMAAVNESGLYELIGKSKKPEAKPFKDWMHDKVLPSIRQSGGYATSGSVNALPVGGADEVHFAIVAAYDEQFAQTTRTVVRESQTWYCLQDLADNLGLSNAQNVSRSKFFNPEGLRNFKVNTSGGEQTMIFISVENMATMIARSNKDKALEIVNYAFKVILPKLRQKHISAPILPDIPQGDANDPIIQMMSALIVQRTAQLETERRVAYVENRIDKIEQTQREAAEAVKALPGVEARELTPREACREGVRRLRELTSMGFQDIWREAYSKYNIIMGTNVSVHAEKKGIEKMDYIEKFGDIETFLGVIKRMITKAAETATV